ncbi:TonB-dependent receptor [Paraglaciecola aquimarina]|uniref:TonB-dependent receptor n=1 Tax=Paraglaciecola algarum TaxID=3050085 RepID=A0ABS9D816_9ALTE|nr:TonB-dependent receptor [Paraglaciecola sp. G1-23]MCF2948940.1 TonB-dependent receptor [Paraglaciecola sp. G1-23]
MNTSKINKITQGILLSCVIGSTTVGISTAANAQEVSSDNIEKIEIRGLRASSKANLNEKRFANAIVDAITAEDIGQFPDKNVAESLSRIPGITIDRTFGEGQGVTIRGVQPDQNLTLVNGQAVGTANWFVLSDATRNFNFEILASEMVAGLEVYKSAQADIDEGALGGTVILRTRKPMDLDSNTIQFSTEAQYNDESGNTDPSFSGLYSWKNEDETFGILASASYQQRSVVRETNEDFGWFGPTIPRIDPLIEAPQGASEKGAIPWGMGSALFEQDRERIGYDINAQWRPTDNLDMNLHYLSSTMKADNYNSNLIGIGFRGVAFLGTDTNPGTSQNGVIESLQVSGVDNRPGWARHMAYDNIFREGSEMSTQILDFEGNYTMNSGTLHWQIGTTTGEGDNRDFFTEFWVDATDPDAKFDFYNPGGTAPSIDFTTASPWLTNPTDQMWLGGIFDQANTTKDKENYAQVDYTHEVEMGIITDIKTGFKLRDRSFTQGRVRTDLANLAPVGEGSLGPASDFWTGDLINVDHSNTAGFSASYFLPSRDLMHEALYAVPECTTGATTLCRNSDVFLTASSFEIEETINAIYAMANFSSDGIRGNIGMRYVETDSTSNGYDLVSGQAISSSSEYNEWLPSVNLAYDLDQDTILRFAASRVLTRPAPFQLAPAVNLTPETSSGSAGNPNLNPLTANQFEFGVEHYFDEASLVAVTLFKKDVNDFIFTKTVAKEINGQQINQLRTPENGGSTTIDGVEFQVQHVIDYGFGGYFNYTYTDVGDATFDEAVPVTDADGNITGATLSESTVRFPNTSKNSYNFGVFYENDLYSARLNYNYRSEYFIAAAEIGDQFRDEQAQMDAQFSYVLTDNITLKFEALNLTNEIWENYYERNTDAQRLGGTQSSNGRRLFVGANFRF